MPRPALRDCNLFFFDCETGGLSWFSADMVEVGCILTDATGKTVLEEYSAKVIPLKPVEPKAAAVNGYTKEKWAEEAIPLEDAMFRMLRMARDSVFVAHNAPFDWGFFGHALALRGQKWPGDYHRVDTVALAWPLLRAGKVANVKLETLAEHFKVDHNDRHTAASDVNACRGVYLNLAEMYERVFSEPEQIAS